MKKYAPELIGVTILLALAAAAFLLLYFADSAIHIVLAILCLVGIKIDIWVYRRKFFGRSNAAEDEIGGSSDLFN